MGSCYEEDGADDEREHERQELLGEEISGGDSLPLVVEPVTEYGDAFGAKGDLKSRTLQSYRTARWIPPMAEQHR